MIDRYGSGPYGEGRYGGLGRLPPITPVVAERPLTPPATPIHLLGVGPWADNIEWRTLGLEQIAAATRDQERLRSYEMQLKKAEGRATQAGTAKARRHAAEVAADLRRTILRFRRRMTPFPTVAGYHLPTYVGPSRPIMAIEPTSMSFTLRRSGPAEARIELDTPQDQAVAIEEMVTDLWWRRHDPNENTTELIGRFNVDTVDLSAEGGRLKMSATCVDYRTVVGERLIANPLAAKTYVKGTAVTQVLREIIPANTAVNLAVLNTASLGTINAALEVAAGSTVETVISALAEIAPPFDWAIEPDATLNMQPTLRLWPGGRSSATTVVLTDLAEGYSPIRTWSRRSNRQDYANAIWYSGRAESYLAIISGLDLPEGQRDAYESNDSLCGTAAVQAAAEAILSRRSARAAGWTLNLSPGFWRGRSHIDIGDHVTVAVRVGAGVIRATHPVEDIEVSIDRNAVEDVSLGLGLPRPARDPRSRRSFHGRILTQLRSMGKK
jgi:hypothetical protein